VSESIHGRQIAAAARQHLAPLGFFRKGRSRTWLGDRSWYLVVVEFQPSGFSQGSYLNTGACFLWRAGEPHLSFDLGDRVENFHPYENESQFDAVATSLATRAVVEVKSLDSRLASFSATAEALLPETSWWRPYHRAIALALAGESDAARTLFQRVRSDVKPASPSWVQDLSECCAELEQLLLQEPRFRDRVVELINARRQGLKLPPLRNTLEGAA
jgi:HPt (histidine-containing phosphotransfer) domain-containing protein